MKTKRLPLVMFIVLGISIIVGFTNISVADSTNGGETHYNREDRNGYVPHEGFVPDADTAVKIAEAVWAPIYGTEAIEGQKPFNARLVGDVWVVEGTLPPDYLGGVVEAEISRKDGCVLWVSHGK